MKSFRVAPAVLAAALALFSARAAELKQITAELKQITGPSKLITINGEHLPLEKGKVLKEGSTIVADAEATAAFVIKEQKIIARLKSNGTLSFDKMQAHTGSEGKSAEIWFDLKEGKLVVSASKVGSASKFEIKTAKGVFGIRGTDFAVGSDGSAHCRKGTLVAVFVINGVANPPITVQAGESLSPPVIPGGTAKPSHTPPDIAAALDKEIKELKKLAGYR